MFHPRWVMRLILQMFALSALTTFFLMIALNRDFESPVKLEHVKRRFRPDKEYALNKLRKLKLTELQKIMFVNPDRPPDRKYNINVTLSEKIPLDRDIPDTRPSACLQLEYDTKRMPKTSIVIIFYNEALSMLLRTVHSILQRTPEELLEEIILVNDHSTNADLKVIVNRYFILMICLPPKISALFIKIAIS